MSIEDDKNRIERLQNDLNQANLKKQQFENELNRTRQNLKEFQLKRQDVEEKLMKAQEELAEIQEESGDDLTEVQEKLSEIKGKYKVTTMVLATLLGLALGACYYFYSQTASKSSFNEEKIAEIKSIENSRVLDSIERANLRALRNHKNDAKQNGNDPDGINSENLDKTIEKVNENTNGETIYSVQIGVFQKDRFPLLSTETIPSIVTSDNRYFKYSLGLFTTLDEAKQLKKELIKLGISDAFVASYIDGKRQKIHD